MEFLEPSLDTLVTGPEILLTVILGLALIGAVLRWGLRSTTVFEYERGLRYSRGRFDRTLEPGQYWYMPFRVRIDKVDVRPRCLSVSGQEVLTSDGVAVKVSLASKYEIVDPDRAVNKAQDYTGMLYLELQMAAREIVSKMTADEVVEGRDQFTGKLMELSVAGAENLGLKLHGVHFKDVMFPGALKQSFAQVVLARKEGEAALERARGETAALRSLANAAKLMEESPALLQLRLLHSLSGSTGNTLVLGVPESFPVVTNGRGHTTGAATTAAKKTTKKKKT